MLSFLSPRLEIGTPTVVSPLITILNMGNSRCQCGAQSVLAQLGVTEGTPSWVEAGRSWDYKATQPRVGDTAGRSPARFAVS